MIRYPYIGQRVRIWYGAKVRRNARASSIPYHAREGVVVGVARGRGPRNVLVGVGAGDDLVVVPRGNLDAI